MDCGGVDVPVDVLAFGFFGKNHRDVEMPRCHTGNGNAGGFDGQDFVDAVVFKNSIEFGANLIQ